MRKINRLSCVILVFTFLLTKGMCQIDGTQVMPVDPKVRIGRLANGLTYYIRQNSLPAKRVELRLVVNTGSVLEDDDQAGLAHFMEHMNFNGTKRFPRNELVNYLQSIGVQLGADLNAYTSFDETVYILPVPSDKPGLIDKGLEILEDWAHNALLDPVEINKERGVVIEEWRLSRGAEERMMMQTLPIQLKGSRYSSRIPIGNKSSIENFSPATLERFYKDWYRPDLQAIIVVGDVDVNDIEQKIRTVFSDIPASTQPRKRESFPVPDHKEPYVVLAKDRETAFPSIEIMYKKDALPETTVADYARYMNQRLFSAMLNNRFREIMLRPGPPFLNAFSYYGHTVARSKDALHIFINTSDTGMRAALATVLTENRRVLLHGFTASEFELQKKQMQSQYDRIFEEREKEESYKYVNEYINNFLVNEPIPGIEWEYDFVKQYLASARLDEINALAKTWITGENMVVTLNAPEKDNVVLPASTEITALINEVSGLAVLPYHENKTAGSLLDPSKLKPGKIISTSVDDALQTTTYKLSNGATVILKSTNYKNDEILFRAFSKGGHSLAKDADYYSASNAASIVNQSGIGNFTSLQLSNALKGKNTSVSAYINAYSEGLTGTSSPKEAESLLQVSHLFFTAPCKDRDAFDSYITRQKQLLENISANPEIFFSVELQKIMTGNHPRAAFPKPVDFDKINLDRSIQFYRERFANAGDFTFLFVGSIDEKSFRPLIEKYIGSLPGNATKENFRDLGIRPPAEKTDIVVNKGADQKSIVSLIFISPAKYSPAEVYGLKSLADLVDIRLTRQLREEKSTISGVSVSGNMNKVPYNYSNFSISFPCAPENTDTITKAVVDELKTIIERGVSKEEVASLKEQQKRKLETEMGQNQFWMTSLYDAYYLGNDPKDILEKYTQVEKLTPETLSAIAKKYLNPNGYIRVVLKPGLQEQKPLKGF